jgi:predicted nucleic acid-binding protein
VITLLDTGPLVAVLDRSDKHHSTCAKLLSTLPGRLLVPATVVVEVCWMVEQRPDVEAAFLNAAVGGEFELVGGTEDDLGRTAELVSRYADFPLGAVDASVIAMAERLDIRQVATLDRRHFPAVRPRHVEALTLVP